MPSVPSEYSRILKNFFSLNLVQISNIIFPLIILPYVVRVLGVEKFGLISFVQSFIMYFVIISDYGFNLAGTREISVNRGNPSKISEIFYSILILKILLGIICLSIILALILSSVFFRNNWILYLVGTGILFGSILFPYWFFQGIEKMEIIPIINISIKTVQLVLIFLLIKNKGDYILYLIIISAIQLIIGITGFFVSISYLKSKPFFPGIKPMTHLIKKGFTFFSTSLGINIFNNSNTFVVGIIGGEYAAGIFSAADKIRLSIQGIISSFITSVFPVAVQLAEKTKEKFIHFLQKIFGFSLFIGIGAGFIFFFLAEDIVLILLGPAFMKSIILVKLFSIVIITFSIGEIFAYLVLLPYQHEKTFNKIILISIALHVTV